MSVVIIGSYFGKKILRFFDPLITKIKSNETLLCFDRNSKVGCLSGSIPRVDLAPWKEDPRTGRFVR